MHSLFAYSILLLVSTLSCRHQGVFNWQCLKRQLIPAYPRIKAPNTSPAHKYTQHKIPNIRIKDEIKYLHSKKRRLNQQIYHLHLYLANTWDNTWTYIQNTLGDKLLRETRNTYKTLDKKLKNLSNTQTETPQEKDTFYPRVVNNTDISSSHNEMALLQKGLRYDIHSKKKTGYKT